MASTDSGRYCAEMHKAFDQHSSKRYTNVLAKHSASLILLALAICASTSANAEIYSCKDEAGRTITSDRPLPDCGNRAIRVLRPDGLQKGEIAAPLTAEQKAQKDAADERRRAQENAIREQKQYDRALMAAFPTVQALEASRKRQVAEIAEEIAAAKRRIELKYPDLQAAQAELEFYKSKPVPGFVRNKIQSAASAILVEDELITAKNSEIEMLNKKYDSDGKRLRELVDPATGKLAQATKH